MATTTEPRTDSLAEDAYGFGFQDRTTIASLDDGTYHMSGVVPVEA
ncbi:hypothetical protein [Haloarchaeobius sp. HRN-SO-5]